MRQDSVRTSEALRVDRVKHRSVFVEHRHGVRQIALLRAEQQIELHVRSETIEELEVGTLAHHHKLAFQSLKSGLSEQGVEKWTGL